MKKAIAIIGAGGLIGKALVKKIEESNCNFNINAISGRILYLKPEEISKYIDKCSYIVNLAGEPVNGRWTKRKKERILNSRVNTTENLIEALKLLKEKPVVLINASGISIYKDNRISDELNVDYDDNFLSYVVKRWESEALKAYLLNIDVAIIRIAVVLSKDGGAYPNFRKLIRYGFTGIMGDGMQNFSFIHINDLVNAILFIINKKITGVINCSSPEYVNNISFIRFLSKKLNRRILYKMPLWLLKFLFLEGHILLTTGQRAYPGVLLKNGFHFIFPDIEQCIWELEK